MATAAASYARAACRAGAKSLAECTCSCTVREPAVGNIRYTDCTSCCIICLGSLQFQQQAATQSQRLSTLPLAFSKAQVSGLSSSLSHMCEQAARPDRAVQGEGTTQTEACLASPAAGLPGRANTAVLGLCLDSVRPTSAGVSYVPSHRRVDRLGSLISAAHFFQGRCSTQQSRLSCDLLLQPVSPRGPVPPALHCFCSQFFRGSMQPGGSSIACLRPAEDMQALRLLQHSNFASDDRFAPARIAQDA